MTRIALKVSWIVAATIALAVLVGCTVKDPYRAAIRGSADVSEAVSSGIKITSQYYSSGTINDSQKAAAARYFTIVTDCNMTFRKTVTDVHNAGQTGVQAFLPIADGFVVCVKNSAPASTDPKVQSILSATDTAIHGVEVAIAAAKGGN